MLFIAKTILAILFVLGFFAFGYDTATRSFSRQPKDNRKAKQACLAKIDLWSYLTTSLPLFGLLVILIVKDPEMIGGPINLRPDLAEFIAGTLAIIAAGGVGAGCARRKLSLQLARE
jgi:hypothetical protein